MGACCTTGKGQVIPDTNTTTQRQMLQETKSSKQIGYDTDSSDSNYEGETQESAPEYDGHETSISMTYDSRQKIITGFKDAVRHANESLVMYYNQENPSLNLLDIRFEKGDQIREKYKSTIDLNGDSTLHVAVRKKADRLIIYLLDNGVSPNIQNALNGDTPLIYAARDRNERCVAILLKYDADINTSNHKRETALTIAHGNGDDEIIELLSPTVQDIFANHIRNGSQSKDIDSDNPDEIPMLDNMDTQRLDDLTQDVLAPQPKLNDDDSSLKPLRNYQINKDGKLPTLENDKSLEEKLDAKTMRKLQEIRIAQTNPFSKLERRNTQITLQAMQNITAEASNLPKLEAWLELKKQKPPYSYQKRWVIVKESHFLWSDKQRTIKDPKSAKERNKFNGNISLLMITKIEPIIKKGSKKSKSQRKFKITAREGAKSKVREYLWRAASSEDRDYWCSSLQAHLNHMKALVTYLGTKQ